MECVHFRQRTKWPVQGLSTSKRVIHLYPQDDWRIKWLRDLTLKERNQCNSGVVQINSRYFFNTQIKELGPLSLPRQEVQHMHEVFKDFQGDVVC